MNVLKIKNLTLYILWILLIFWIVGVCIYFTIIRFLLTDWLTDSNHAVIEWAVFVYPKFAIYLAQNGANAALLVTDQLVMRMGLIILLIIFFQNLSGSIWMQTIQQHQVNDSLPQIYILLFYPMVFLFSWRSYWELNALRAFEDWSSPFSYYRLLPWIVPPKPLLMALVVLQWSMAVLTMWRNSAITGWIFAATFIYLEGIQFCYQGISHHFATFGHIAILLPWLLFTTQQTSYSRIHPNIVLFMLRASIILPYTMAGLEKLLFNGFNWPFSGYFADLGMINSLVIGQALAIMVLIFQLFFIVTLYKPFLLWFFIPAGIIFHISIYRVIDVGSFLHPWYLSYIFLIDFSKIKDQVLKIMMIKLNK